MTSTADRPGRSRALGWVRSTLLVLAIVALAAAAPPRWALVGLAVPLLAAGSLLLAWRFGRAALLLPLALALGAGALIAWPLVPGLAAWHVLWLPAASLTGAWMGLREEGGGPSLGARAWMHAPLLAVAFALPVLPGFPAAVARLMQQVEPQQREWIERLSHEQASGPSREMLEQWMRTPLESRVRWGSFTLANAAFLWMVVLVAAGRGIAGAIAAGLRWPPLSRANAIAWRLPDAALAPLIGGLALALFAGRTWQPGAATLLAQSVLGYSVQGAAVLIALFASRGVPLAFILMTLVFLLAFTLPVFLPSLALIGLSDVWLDYRKLEPSPRGEA